MISRQQSLIWVVIAAVVLLFLTQVRLGDQRSGPPSADLSSPERAIKSYWTLREWSRRQAAPLDTPHAAPSLAEVMSAVTAGSARDSYQTRPGGRDQLEWSLLEIQQTGPDEAVAVARVRRAGQESGVLTPTPIELFQSGQATQLRYSLIRDAQGWKVTEVWRLEPEGRRVQIR